jgi:CRISPR-associated protein (TIGR03986 family)
MTTVTPLLSLDVANRTEADVSDHWVYGVRVGSDGLPAIAPTSVKGMLRSAYEAVTNSRFGVFEGHDARLAYRMPAAEGLRMVPARVSDDGATVELLPGTAPIGRQGGKEGALYAAWLPAYSGGRVTYSDRSRPQHGEEVVALVELVQHRSRRDGRDDFRYWQVRDIAPANGPLPAAIADASAQPPAESAHPGARMKIRGWVCWTNQNIYRKHDERVFFRARQPVQHPLTDELKKAWTELISNYQDLHKREVGERGAGKADEYRGPTPGKTAWSRHVYEPSAKKLAGSLCYARLDARGRPERLYPVTISRDLFEVSPDGVLDDSLKPPTKPADLSPADRVFGWVNGVGPGAHRGQLRVGPIVCDPASASGSQVETFKDPIPLAILGEPKPQQGRFYVAGGRPERPRPLEPRVEKRLWYRPAPERSLRGRKAYLHHAGLPDGYWEEPPEGSAGGPVGGRYREYRRPPEGPEGGGLTADRTAFVTKDDQPARDNQNRSISGWVRPRTVFRFTVEVTNVSDVELGALLWLLRLPGGHFHRLGFGKPLGFGSVRLDVDQSATDLRPGAAWRERWMSLRDAPPAPPLDVNELVEEFRRAVGGNPFEDVPFIRGFLAVARGDPSVPVHYPRVRAGIDRRVPVPPDPRGQAFEWFVDNERVHQREIVHGVSLPEPWGEPLEIYPGRPGR